MRSLAWSLLMLAMLATACGLTHSFVYHNPDNTGVVAWVGGPGLEFSPYPGFFWDTDGT